MPGMLVDSCVILDVFQNDPAWAERSEALLANCATRQQLFINPVIYAEISIGFQRIEELEEALAGCGLRMLPLPREALFLAGKAFLRYRRRQGRKASPLPDFFIGAHAAVEQLELLTRDVRRVKTYFPTVKLVSP